MTQTAKIRTNKCYQIEKSYSLDYLFQLRRYLMFIYGMVTFCDELG